MTPRALRTSRRQPQGREHIYLGTCSCTFKNIKYTLTRGSQAEPPPPPRCVLGQVPSFSCPGSPLPLTQNRRHGSFSWGSGGFAAFPFHFAFFMDVYFEKAFVRQSCISKTETKSLKRGRKEGREGVAGVACRY